MAATKKTAAKKSTAKSSAAKSSATKPSATKKTAAKTTNATKAAAKKSGAKKAPAKTAAKKAAASTSKSTAKKSTTKATPAKAPAKKAAKSPLDKKFIDAQKKLLLEERERYTKSAKTWKDEADSLVESREPGDVQFDEESGEGDSLAVERERDLALSSLARAAVDQIDAALERVAAGTYGICVESGKPIPKERLKAIPWAAERVEYKAGGFRRR